MKKRILSILLLCCMVLTLLPTAAFAADTGKAIQLGTDALSKNVNTASAPTVYFGQDHENNPAAWRVIGYNGNGVASAQGDMTLLAAGNMSSVLQFGDFGTNNRYASSYLKTAIDALAEKLTTEENTAVKKRTLTSGSYNGENTDCVAGEQVDNAVFWPLSTAEAFAVNQDLRIVDPEHPSWASSYWWLRSPGYSDHDAATVNGDGSVVYSGNAISSWWCVRPAFNLNSSSVLFTSAAVGGKPDGGLTPISKYTGNEWKLTLKDSNRNFAVTETTVSGDPGDTVTLHYTGATAGINEYISVILADNSGAQYYGRVAQPTAENGTVEIKIPSGLAPGSYTLKAFSEQCNDDKKTDYASDFVDIDLTVGYQEQFTLTPGGTYYFDLSGENIPGTANGSLPDKTMHYVPFTYAGTVDAYKLTSEMATTEEYAEQNKYAHSLFVADYTVTHTISWNDLNTAGLIFGKGYAAGGVDYTLRAPSAGSSSTGPSFYIHGAPQSNEWDRILDKDERYIQNIVGLYSWGQDTPSASASQRVGRGYYPLRGWSSAPASYQTADAGFRPVLEVLGLDKLGYDGLKAVTLDLGGGTLGGSSEDIQIIVKNSSVFTAPASNGLTRPDGDTGSYFKWLGSDGELYEPGDSVSADVTRLTAQFVLIEQFRLAPGGTYYFDLSAMSIPGTVNSNLPDQTMHYVPFTYVGIVDAYKLTSETATTEEYAEKNKYPHSLFVADYAVTGAVNWNVLNNASLIFGKDYAAGGVDYMLRAPSVGSGYTGQDELQRRTPQSNEWDRILDKNDGYIKNWSEGYSWGQDTSSASSSHRGIRWNGSSHKWASADTKFSLPALRFHPVLEVLSPGTLGPDGLKAVTLDLGGGTLGGSSEDIQIIVKNSSVFTAPASNGLTRPDGDTGSYFKWLGSDGELYEPGDSVSADVTKLTAQFASSSHSVTITTATLPDGKVGEAYSQTLIATGTAPITWSIDGGLPAGLSLNADTGEISGTPTADGTAKFTVKATNSAGSDTKELSITITKAPAAEYTVTVTTVGGGTASASHAKAAAGTTITLNATPDKGYHLKEWQVISGGVTIVDDKFTMPDSEVEVKAIFEKDAPPAPTEFIVTFDGNGGTSSVGSMTTTNQKLSFLPSASRSKHSFDGWYTEKSGGTKITTATIFSANTTVYAHWTYTGGGGGGYNPPVTYYTLRFETGGGSDIPSVREAYNAYIDLSQYVPTWRGHTFIGWYTERSLMNKVSGVYLTKDMTVYAGWRVDENPGTGANPFTDVSEKDWFYGDVMFVYENGLMLGTSKTLFSPHGTATRGMMATILWRMEGSPAPKGKNSFTDVEAGKWYADAITWTAENGIFAGYGKDKFGPDDPITREQLAAIFYRYADYKGYDLTVKGNLDTFKDADKITDYAKTAMQWAVGSGLMKGKSGNLLDPQGTATRAEIAAMLHRFIEKYELVQGKAPGGLMGWIDPKRLQIPKTGDSSVLGLWGFSLCTSLAGCLALTTWQIRRRREEEALQIVEK